jgi:cytochrome c biogenesis protein CcmG/thiol:disulfide interchange protein DsbE
MRRAFYLLPLLVFFVLAGYFWVGLGKDPAAIPSPLIDRPVPAFDLAPIGGREAGLSSSDLKGEPSLVNIFGSWCVACMVEHPVLMGIKAAGLVPIHGVNWREVDARAGPAWLARHGDPYTRIGADPDSKAAIALGVTGAPETFVVDADGVIRYKHTGPITEDVWEDTLWPIVARLQRR